MNPSIDVEAVRSLVLALPEISAWPEAAGCFLEAHSAEITRPDWQLPSRASQAVGGDPELALAAVAAVACLQISIILVDDILDEDPHGRYRVLGAGKAANLGLAFQAAALSLLNDAKGASPAARSSATAALAKAALATAFGQSLDVQNLSGEANYWRIVRAKSTPFYGAALQVGALLAEAPTPIAQALYDVGVLFGEIIQVFDDLVDAFQAPAGPDWRQGRNNLCLLYAATATHPERERFLDLLLHVDDTEVLAEAQQVLIRSGAVSYCVYQMVHRYQTARTVLADVHLADPTPLMEVVEAQITPVVAWLETIGIATPAEFARAMA